MKTKTIKYIFIAVAIVATVAAMCLPTERKVTHMVSSNPAERQAKR